MIFNSGAESNNTIRQDLQSLCAAFQSVQSRFTNLIDKLQHTQSQDLVTTNIASDSNDQFYSDNVSDDFTKYETASAGDVNLDQRLEDTSNSEPGENF